MESYRAEGFLRDLQEMGLLKLKCCSSHTFEDFSEKIYIEQITPNGKRALFSPEDLINSIPMTSNPKQNIHQTTINAEKIDSLHTGSGNINNYSAPEKNTLAEVVAEIQKLLQQLEQSNPTATESEQIQYVNIATNPELKQRMIAAAQSGGETALEEFVLDNKYLKVIKAIIKGWITGKS